MPDPIPVMVLARLAVDSAYRNQGSALLKDALLRTIAAAEIAGIRAMLLHAMSDDAKHFSTHAGFHECPVQ
jgi:GNAT superfamily N-acetyltransferase